MRQKQVTETHYMMNRMTKKYRSEVEMVLLAHATLGSLSRTLNCWIFIPLLCPYHVDLDDLGKSASCGLFSYHVDISIWFDRNGYPSFLSAKCSQYSTAVNWRGFLKEIVCDMRKVRETFEGSLWCRLQQMQLIDTGLIISGFRIWTGMSNRLTLTGLLNL